MTATVRLPCTRHKLTRHHKDAFTPFLGASPANFMHNRVTLKHDVADAQTTLFHIITILGPLAEATSTASVGCVTLGILVRCLCESSFGSPITVTAFLTQC